MGFIGSVPQQARVLIGEVLKGIDRNIPIYVLCSGNFTIDKIAYKLGFKVHSCDVSFYSKVVADFVQGKKTDFSIKDSDLKKIYDSWEDHPMKDVVFVMYVMKLGEFNKRSNDFLLSNWNRLIEQNEDYYKMTLEKLEKNQSLDFKIESYFHGDLVERVKEAKGGVTFSFAPTYKGGYEKIYGFIEEVFEYERAEYTIFDSKDAGKMYEGWLNEQKVLIYTDHEWEEIAELMKGKILMPKPKKDILFYSNVNEQNYLIRDSEKKQDQPGYKIVDRDKDFSKVKEVSVRVVKTSEVNYYKAKYMSAKVEYSEGGDFGLMFFVDGELFGMATFSKFLSNQHYMFLQSDFIPSIDFPQVSKLLIMLLKSNDIKKILTRILKHSYKGLKTSVFTDKPISMKYRGVFELIERKPKEKKLIYQGDFNKNTINENFKLWQSKIKK